MIRSGGQALVYRAQASWGELVAVKVAREARLNPWMERERETLASLAAVCGGWLVELLDHGTTPDGRIFMVLPWFDQTLHDWLTDGPPLRDRFTALAQACEAVYRLHHSSVDAAQIRLHRDIKPANLLLRHTRDGREIRVVLADLGGVKQAGMLSVGAQTGLHTPDFAPAEQGLPIQRAPDPSLDIHALGVTVFYALTGMPPASVTVRRAYFSERAHRLLELYGRRAHLAETQAAELAALRILPLSGLIALDELEALSQSDEARLRNLIYDQLLDTSLDPAATTDALLEQLLPPLRRALAPDPDSREQDARRLLAACRRCAELLSAPHEPAAPVAAAAATGHPRAGPVPPGTPSGALTLDPLTIEPPLLEAPTRERRRRLAPVGLLAVGMLGVVALSSASWLADPTLTTRAIQTPPLHPEILPPSSVEELPPAPPPTATEAPRPIEAAAAMTAPSASPPEPPPLRERPRPAPQSTPLAEVPAAEAVADVLPPDRPRLLVRFPDSAAEVYAASSSALVGSGASFSLDAASEQYQAYLPGDRSVRCGMRVRVAARDAAHWTVTVEDQLAVVASDGLVRVTCGFDGKVKEVRS